MYKQIAILVAVSLLSFAGCKKDETVTETKGDISVTPAWPSGASGASRVTVTITPGGMSQTSTSLSSIVTFSGVDPGTYTVSAEAYDASSNMTHSSSSSSVTVSANETRTVTVVMQTLVPSTPTSISASKSSTSAINVSWNASNRATGYKIYYVSTANSSTTTFTHYGDQARWYNYQVSAYNAAGESPKSPSASGYRAGWRFDNVSYYTPSNGIGFNYDLHAYGFKNQEKAAAVYAIYYRNGGYYYVPGSGFWGCAAYKFVHRPSYDESFWNQSWAYVSTTAWDAGYRNNTYPQYIQLRVYKSNSISTLNDPSYDETAIFSIRWGGSSDRPVPIIIRQLSAEESAKISSQLAPNPAASPSSANGTNLNSGRASTVSPQVARIQ